MPEGMRGYAGGVHVLRFIGILDLDFVERERKWMGWRGFFMIDRNQSVNVFEFSKFPNFEVDDRKLG
jgi:hypothetical protein